MYINKLKILNRVVFPLIFLLVLAVILVTIYLTFNSSFWGDDIYFSHYFQGENFFGCLVQEEFTQQHGGRYLGLFFSKFFSFGLPSILGIHPADFIGVYQGFVKGILIAFTLLVLTNFVRLVNRSKLLYLSMFYFLVGYFFYSIYSSNTWVPYITYNYYRYCVSLLFLGYFFNFMFENLLKKQVKKNKRKLVFASFCAFIVGTSIELSFFGAITIFCLVILYNLILSYFAKNVKNKQQIESLMFNLDLNFYIPNFFLIIAIALFTSSRGFREVALSRGLGDIQITFEGFKEFCLYYYQYCIKDEFILWITFLILVVIATCIAKKRNELKLIVILCIYYFSFLLVLFSLILCGKTCNMTWGNQDMTYFISHINLIFLYKMLFFVPIMILFAYVVKRIRRVKSVVLFSSLIIISLISYFPLYSLFMGEYNRSSFLKMKKAELYTAEKLLRFYYLRNETPILPMHLNDWFLCSKDIICVKNTQMTWYYMNIYKNSEVNEIGYCREENALEKFYSLGGFFTEKELENIEFFHLYDENFVLKKVDEADGKLLTPEEVLKLITNVN